MRRNRKFALYFILLLLLTACAPQSITYPEWKPADVRYIDPLDAASEQSELIAVGVRRVKQNMVNQRVFIRLDFLETLQPQPFDIFILLKFFPTGNPSLYKLTQDVIPWNFGIQIQSPHNQINVFDEQYQPISEFPTSIFHQSNQDALVIHFWSVNPHIIIPENFTFQVILVSPEDGRILDSTSAISSTALASPPVRVLFAFWNTFPAFTPVQTLRRWDGAHTGPLGGRHGLYNLVRTAVSNEVPIVLLDTINPFSLSSLDFAKKLDFILQPENSMSLILPRVTLKGESNTLQISKLPKWYDDVYTSFAIHTNGFMFLQNEGSNGTIEDNPLFNIPCPNNQIIFSLQDNSGIVSQVDTLAGCRFIRIPQGVASQEYQPTMDGLPTSLKKALIQAYSNFQSNTMNGIVVLGGDLPLSSWGDAQIAREAFQELKSLPWVEFMDENELRSLGNFSGAQPPSTQQAYPSASGDQAVVSHLDHHKLDLIQGQFIAVLSAPVYPQNEKLSDLRGMYRKIIPAFSVIDQWVQNPISSASCSVDITSDQYPDCYVANENLFLWIDPRFGTILLTFYRFDHDLHEIISPGFQLANGYSDSMAWDLSQGIYAEQIPHFFALKDEHPYQNFTLQDHGIVLTNSTGKFQKRISINGNHLHVSYNSPPSNQPLYIPLIVDPWQRFQPSWAENYSRTSGDNFSCWSVKEPKVSVCLKQDTLVNLYTFKDTEKRFDTTEDPNVGNPLGHFLPYPMAVFEVSSEPSKAIELDITIFPEIPSTP